MLNGKRESAAGGIGLLLGFALLKVLIHLPVLTRYGYHHDELYFIACGEHLSFGYVDHAPLVPWIARLVTACCGESLFALRILATLAGAATVFLTGLLARRLGGGRFAQVLACIAVLIAPVYLRTGNMLCLPAFEPLFWVLGFHLLAGILRDDDARAWPWLGAVCGLGLLNKHSMLFFGFGLLVGLVLTPLRRHLARPRLYLGGAIALLILLPNLVWQAWHDWPTAHFLINLNAGVMSGISPVQFLLGQLLYLHPLNALLWASGLGFFLFAREGRPFRLFGWMWLSVFLLLLLIDSKIYYIAPAYPVLLAGGGLVLERWFNRLGKAWPKPVAVGALALGGIGMAPPSLPILDIDSTERYVDAITFGAFENVYELTGDLRGMFGWEQRVAAVAAVWQSLPEAERARTAIVGTNIGNTGAIDHLGGSFGLPGAYCLDLTYWIWGPPEGPIETVIGAGFGPDSLSLLFEEVSVAAEVPLEHVNPWQTPFVVTVGRRPKATLKHIWPLNRPW